MAISEYLESIRLVLLEASKFLVVLILTVLAIRMWRRFPKLSGSNRNSTGMVAAILTVMTLVAGYLGMTHSLGLLYSAYGMKAFGHENIPAALSLFRQSEGYWKTADNAGGAGICLLLLEQRALGEKKLEQARLLRKGVNSGFESHYSGLYYFTHNQPKEAFPRLRAAAGTINYRWTDSKLLAVMLLDNNQPADALELMGPYAQVAIQDCDHAYVMIALMLHQHKRDEAAKLLRQFPAETLSEFWKPRFENLRSQV